MRGLDRRVVLLERTVMPRRDDVEREWDAALNGMTTDELRAVLAAVRGETPTGAWAEHLESGLKKQERAGGAPAEAACQIRAWCEARTTQEQ